MSASKHADAVGFITCDCGQHIYVTQEQPSLRDRLAMAALPAVISCDPSAANDFLAEESYRIADAMLKERAKRGKRE